MTVGRSVGGPWWAVGRSVGRQSNAINPEKQAMNYPIKSVEAMILWSQLVKASKGGAK